MEDVEEYEILEDDGSVTATPPLYVLQLYSEPFGQSTMKTTVQVHC